MQEGRSHGWCQSSSNEARSSTCGAKHLLVKSTIAVHNKALAIRQQTKGSQNFRYLHTGLEKLLLTALTCEQLFWVEDYAHCARVFMCIVG